MIKQLDRLPPEQLTEGFVAGFGLAIISSTFGVVGGLLITKSLLGFSNNFRSSELMIKYHDRLREVLGENFKE